MKKPTLLIFDTEIDPEWIEALNSVLDDNRLLTLPSGERLQYDQDTKFIFEVRKLDYASPATISRMGLINMSTLNYDHKSSFKNIQLEDEELNGISQEIIENMNKNSDHFNSLHLSFNIDHLTKSMNLEKPSFDSIFLSALFLSSKISQQDFKNKYSHLLNERTSGQLEFSPNELVIEILTRIVNQNIPSIIIYENLLNSKILVKNVMDSIIS